MFRFLGTLSILIMLATASITVHAQGLPSMEIMVNNLFKGVRNATRSSTEPSLSVAQSNYTARFRPGVSASFSESPFKGWFMMEAAFNTAAIFNEDADVVGYAKSWSKYNEFGQKTDLGEEQAEQVLKDIRKSLRKEWMVDSGYGSGTKATVIYTTPDCANCIDLENTLRKYSDQLGARIYVMPTMADNRNRVFEAAILCSPDPSAAWKKAVDTKVIPETYNGCPTRKLLATTVDTLFKQNVYGQFTPVFPTIIRPDGSVVYGWKKGQDMASIIETLGAQQQ